MDPSGGITVEVRVELKPGVADAEALAIEKSLTLLGVNGLRGVRTVRVYRLTFGSSDPDEALRQARLAVDRLLANPVIHQVEIRAVGSPSARTSRAV